MISMVSRGYSEKIRVLLCRSRTYDLPMTSSDAQALSYRRLVGARPRSMISMVSRGYSEKVRVLLKVCRSQTYNLPMTSSHAQALIYRRHVGARL